MYRTLSTHEDLAHEFNYSRYSGQNIARLEMTQVPNDFYFKASVLCTPSVVCDPSVSPRVFYWVCDLQYFCITIHEWKNSLLVTS